MLRPTFDCRSIAPRARGIEDKPQGHAVTLAQGTSEDDRTHGDKRLCYVQPTFDCRSIAPRARGIEDKPQGHAVSLAQRTSEDDRTHGDKRLCYDQRSVAV